MEIVQKDKHDFKLDALVTDMRIADSESPDQTARARIVQNTLKSRE